MPRLTWLGSQRASWRDYVAQDDLFRDRTGTKREQSPAILTRLTQGHGAGQNW